MKKKVSLFLIFLLIVGLAYSITLQEILKKNYEARGGLDKLKGIKTLYLEGKMVNTQQNAEMPIKMWYKIPNKMRFEIEMMGKKIVQAYDGEKAWWIMPFLGPEPKLMPEEQAKSFKDQLNSFSPLVDYEKRGIKIEYVGKDDLEGTEVYKLKLTYKSGKVAYYYLDADSGIELMSEAFVSRGGEERKVQSIFSDYKEVNGVYFPFTIETKSGDMTAGSMTFSKILVNKDFPDSIFEFPKNSAK